MNDGIFLHITGDHEYIIMFRDETTLEYDPKTSEEAFLKIDEILFYVKLK